MKETTLRVPDEGELWSNGNNGNWYVVRNGKFRGVGMVCLNCAHNYHGLELALNDFWRDRSSTLTDEVVDGQDGWTLRADDAMKEVERVALKKLNEYKTGLGLASCALTRFMVP